VQAVRHETANVSMNEDDGNGDKSQAPACNKTPSDRAPRTITRTPIPATN
jgi:hypothetical protein